MRLRTYFADRTRWTRILPAALLGAVFFGATAASAGATLRVENHLDPAGDPTLITYRLDSAAWTREPIDFEQRDGESTSFGPQPGTYTVQALVPSGWRVADIKCVGPDPAQFVIDVPNGIVTVTHGPGAEQTCAFTNAKVEASGPPSSGVSPSPPPNELDEVLLPNETALLRVRTGKGYVAARLRLIKRSVISLQLRRNTRVLARKRITRRAGTREVRIALRRDTRRWFRNHGQKRVQVSLRLRVAERNGTTKVFWYRVIIPV
jgi:hypothetical protein